MSKVFRNTLALALLISVAANAPGLLMALGIGDGERGPATPTGAALPPAEEYTFDYGAGTSDTDPGAWLDAFLKDSEMPASAWRHTWTDFDSPPAADALSRYRRSPHWEPEGVLFAYQPSYTAIGEGLVSDISSEPAGKGVYLADFGRGTLRASRGTPGKPQDGKGVQDDMPPTTPPSGGPVEEPDNNPGDQPGENPGDQPGENPGDEPNGNPGENPPGGEEPTDHPPGNPPVTDPPVTVPEPASLGLLALGLAASAGLGRRRRGAAGTSREQE